MRVDDYSRVEMDEDNNTIDWELAYNEILKIEDERKLIK